MKKFAALLLVLSFMRIGFAYAETETGANSEVFTGLGVAAEELNLVLVAFEGSDGEAGPAGTAGPAGLDGVDGQDGVNGVNGVNGVDGATGATGATGTTGAAGATGATGAAGPAGASGGTGPAGPAGPAGSGGGGGGSVGLGQGIISFVPCESDGIIGIDFGSRYTADGFRFNTISLGNPVPFNAGNSDLSASCAGFDITASFIINAVNPATIRYSVNDLVACRFELPVATGWPTTKWQFTLDAATTVCRVNGQTSTLEFNELFINDVDPRIGFEIARVR